MTSSRTDAEPGADEAGRDEEAALATVRELARAVHELAAVLPFEAEPSHHARLMDELAREPGGDE